MMYGTPSWKFEEDATDRIGIRTAVLSKMWVPSQGTTYESDFDGEEPEPPEMPGGVLLVGRQRMRLRAGFRTFYSFEGINGSGKDVTFKDRQHSTESSFETGFSQVSIIKHPNFQKLRTKFGADVLDGQVIWPDTIPGTAGRPKGMIKGPQQDIGDLNPMLGETDYFRMEGTYSFRYASFNLDGLDGVGTVSTSGNLPGRAPAFASRDWLKCPPKIVRRGTIYDITETYWLSGELGWNTYIYGKASNPYGRGSGLRSGSLTIGSL